MKFYHIFLSFFFISSVSFGQVKQIKWNESEGFQSVFQDLDSGTFEGTTNGIIIFEKQDGPKIILDFQGSVGELIIKKDPYQVYDVSTKSYTGYTTSGSTELRYETYALAHKIGIKLENQWFELSTIDGACAMIIDGLEYSYHTEEKTEYLVLLVTKMLELDNWQYLIRTEHTTNPENIDELKPKKRMIYLLPNSTLVFAIRRI